MLSTITWDSTNHPTGSKWDTPGNWVGGVLPGPGDDAVINLPAAGTVILNTGRTDAVNSLTTNANTSIAISNDTLSLAATSAIGGNLTLDPGITDTGTLTGAGTLTVTGLTTWAGGTMSGTGTTNADGGLMIGSASSIFEDLIGRTLNNADATLASSSYYSGNGLHLKNGATLDNQPGARFTFTSDASILNIGSNTFVNAGTLSKTGGTGTSPVDATLNNTGTGSIQVSSGTLGLQEPFSNAGSVTVGSGSTFSTTGDYTQSGGSTKLSGGTLASTTATTTGTIAINGGILGGSGTVSGNVTNNGQVIPGGVGGAGILDITGSYTQGPGASLTANLGGPNPGTGYGQLGVGGTATLAGNLNVNLINGFAPGNNATFQVLNYNPHVGQFATITPENFPGGTTVSTTYNSTNLVLTTSIAATLTSIAVTPANPSVARGLTEQFTATGTYSDGTTANLTSTVTWTSANTTVASINSSGLAATLATGTSTITATSGSASGSTILTVSPAALVSIAVTPANPSVSKGDTEQLTATGTYTDGTTANLTTTASWTLSDITVATVSSTGLATPVGLGTSRITATVGGTSGSITLTATPATAATVNAVSASWGTTAPVALQTAADGLRLLPAGRNNDLPWLGVNKINITLSAPATLASGDITVIGAAGNSYGPVTISGSGTSYVITLARLIATADRVTLTIGNADVATFTRRLDVLPGDINDDGVVTMQDALIVRNEYLGFAPVTVPVIFLDVNGDGVVDLNDYNQARRLIGTKLP